MKFSSDLTLTILVAIFFIVVISAVYIFAYDRGWDSGSSYTLDKVIEIIRSDTTDNDTINPVLIY
jgi:hypothetical protein